MTKYNPNQPELAKVRNTNNLTNEAKAITVYYMLKDSLQYDLIDRALFNANMPSIADIVAMPSHKKCTTLTSAGFNARTVAALLSLSVNTVYLYNKLADKPKRLTSKTSKPKKIDALASPQHQQVESEELTEEEQFLKDMAQWKSEGLIP